MRRSSVMFGVGQHTELCNADGHDHRLHNRDLGHMVVLVADINGYDGNDGNGLVDGTNWLGVDHSSLCHIKIGPRQKIWQTIHTAELHHHGS